ncbi:Chaperone protein-like protein [Emericellopsis cladophorae]|uniref:Chaperone protein-like protein n=1 Tax=Emericellopsis cladophorae TaxID=2686198 RepID=A0A9P9Y7U8_9HYPO|nr:Chaperone protein-like protein [Emericellopsis cladophorae]KAI6785142.1 Chaperone protein-like protein [Emericellopsis cladophorae]
MVAPRDYYADLDLPPTAEAADIKKQYRKLALKYHPDRNPGREQEVNAQFLIIQTAHDILTNPSERANTRPSAAPPPTPPRTESARQRQQAAFGNRKTGYQPHASAFGDEPPVSNSNYTTRPDPSRTVPPRPTEEWEQPETQRTERPMPPPRMPDPLSQFRDNSGMDGRQSSPYMAHSGEKTNPFDVDTSQGAPKVPPKEPHTKARASSAPRSQESPAPSPTEQKANGSQRPSIFSLSEETLPTTAPTQNFARKSADSINTSFTNEDKGQWQFNAGAQPAPASAAPSEDSFTHQQQAEQPPEIPRKEPVGAPETKATPANEPFNPEGWSAQSWNETFAPPSRTNSNPSPLKASRANSRRTNPAKSKEGSTAKEAILVDSDEDEISFIGRGTRPSVASTGSPQAMDIDPPPVTGTATQGPRIVNVQPSRPEWRTDEHDGLPKGVGTTATRESHLRNAEPNLNGAGSEDSAEFQANLADLRNVAPFANADGTGLHSFGSMKDNLPFESKASETIPLEPKPVQTQPLVFPDAPLAPRPPPTMAVPGMPTNNGTWERYVGDFAEYLQKWEDFTGQVTDHFAARKTQIMGLRKEKGYGFLGARSDTDCLEYLKSVQQDNDVRSRWSAACDEHEQRLREFIACREKVR